MKCAKCGKTFSYKLVGTVYPGCKSSEDIDCPYCNNNCGSVMTSQFVETIKEEENEFAKNPKELIIEQETEMMDDMTEGQLAEYLADNFSDFGD